MKAELARRIKTKEEAKAFLNACQGASFAIDDITTRPVKKTPPAPFTTSTLQQEAARKLGYTVAQTMMLAQRLYESGFITYMRTDSVNLSEFATAGSKDAIIKMMGDRYVHPVISKQRLRVHKKRMRLSVLPIWKTSPLKEQHRKRNCTT